MINQPTAAGGRCWLAVSGLQAAAHCCNACVHCVAELLLLCCVMCVCTAGYVRRCTSTHTLYGSDNGWLQYGVSLDGKSAVQEQAWLSSLMVCVCVCVCGMYVLLQCVNAHYVPKAAFDPEGGGHSRQSMYIPNAAELPTSQLLHAGACALHSLVQAACGRSNVALHCATAGITQLQCYVHSEMPTPSNFTSMSVSLLTPSIPCTQ